MLIRTIVERKVPLFAVCRGVQELNVALGGTLHQAVQDAGPYQDHRKIETLPFDEMWGPRHPIELRGQLREWLGRDEIMVNSLHGQGLKRLSDRLEAVPLPRTGWSKPCVARTRAIRSFSACNGTPSGRLPAIPIQWNSLSALAPQCGTRRNERTVSEHG